MYCHRRCVQKDWEIEEDKAAFGICCVCENQGTIYHVKGAPDEYRMRKGGVVVTVINGEEQPVGGYGRPAYFGAVEEEAAEVTGGTVNSTDTVVHERVIDVGEVAESISVFPSLKEEKEAVEEDVQPGQVESNEEPSGEEAELAVSEKKAKIEELKKKIEELEKELLG